MLGKQELSVSLDFRCFGGENEDVWRLSLWQSRQTSLTTCSPPPPSKVLSSPYCLRPCHTLRVSPTDHRSHLHSCALTACWRQPSNWTLHFSVL